MTRTYRLEVDGKGVTMIATPGTTLEEVRRGAEQRFGASRVTGAERTETKSLNQEIKNHRPKRA